MSIDLDAILRCACEAARAAGEVVAPRLGRPRVIKDKASGPVTDCDIEAENAALAVIQRAFPSHGILSEEKGSAGSGPVRWVIDPLDGTSNFIRGIPWYAVSVAFEVGGRVEVGVVYAPSLDLLFAAVRGQGAHLSGRAMQVSNVRTLAGSMVDIGLRQEDWADPGKIACLSRLAATGAEIRSLNACALDLAFVATGWLEGYWDVHTAPWDAAAGALLVTEAGGRVAMRAKATAQDSAAVLLASNAHVGDLLRDILDGRRRNPT